LSARAGTQLTREEAIAFHDANRWQLMTQEELAVFQLNQQFLAMPFPVFHEAVEKLLGRPVWTHEFADSESLLAELAGVIPRPTFGQIVDKLLAREPKP
jgi:hypothetical protein